MSSFDNIIQTPANLETLGQDLWSAVIGNLRKMHNLLKDEHVYSMFDALSVLEDPKQGRNDPLYGDYIRALEKDSDFSFSVAMASAQSGGKSTMLNDILGFPLLPTALNTTTSCAVEIQYGEPAVQVLYYNDGMKSFKEGPTLKGRDTPSEAIWQDLRGLAVAAIRDKIIQPETILYYTDVDPNALQWNDIEMDRNDPRHVVQLYLVLLSMYVGQDKTSDIYQHVLGLRTRLLKKLGMDPYLNYAVRVWWDHPVLKMGFRFIDLPGLGSNATGGMSADGKRIFSHEDISLDYLQKANAIFLFFDPTAAAGDIPSMLDVLLNGESMRNVISRENRITTILNKADMAGNDLSPSFNQIRGVMDNFELKPNIIYPVSAIAGEYLFVERNLFPISRTQKYRREYRKTRSMFIEMMGIEPSEEQLQNMILKALKADYNRKYSFQDIRGREYEISLPQWIEMMTGSQFNVMRVMRALELLRMGKGINGMLEENIKTRITVLKMLQSCGNDLTKELIDSMKDEIQYCIGNVNVSIEKLRLGISEKLGNAADLENVRKAYLAAIDRVEEAISSILTNRANRMQTNPFGNYILKPVQAWLKSSVEKAKNNKAQYEGMKSDIMAFKLAPYMKDADDVFYQMLQKVQQGYDEWLQTLTSLFAELPARLSSSFDRVYRKVRNSQEKMDKAAFDQFFKALYDDLKKSLLTQVKRMLSIMTDYFVKDHRFADLQGEIVNKNTQVVLNIQKMFIEASQKYITMLNGLTFWTDTPCFDMDKFQATVKQPFYTEAGHTNLANMLVQLFTKDYAEGIDDAMSRLSTDAAWQTKSGLGATSNNLSHYIEMAIRGGKLNIQTEIVQLQGILDNYLVRQMKTMMAQVSAALDPIRDYDWAKEEIAGIDGDRRFSEGGASWANAATDKIDEEDDEGIQDENDEEA